MGSNDNHITEIDSLRAFSVLAVVIFHAWPTALPGGFIGVDIFFIISGFVIARSYLFDLISGRRSLVDFYLARFRRLAPALFVVLVSTTLVASVTLPPDRLVAYGWSLLTQPIYLQNFVFWAEGDYFSGALTKPLLHTWSLAIEEQFYILWAGIIVVLRRFPRLIWSMLLLGALVSVALGVILEPQSPKTVFYMLPTRIWEFAIGIIAYLAVRGKVGRSPWIVFPGSIFLALVLVSTTVFFTESAEFPGFQAAFACGASAILLSIFHLYSGSPKLVWLRLAPFTYVGRISYGFYLWHWPPLVFFYSAAGSAAGPSAALVLVAGALLAAIFSYHFVEQPIRRKVALPTSRGMLRFMAVSSVGVFVAGSMFVFSGGLISRYSPDIQQFLSAPNQRGTFRCGKIFRVFNPGSNTCPLTNASGSGGVLILGDSHADVLKEMISKVGAATDRKVLLTVRNCDLGRFGSMEFCSKAVLLDVLAEAQSLGVTQVVAISFWESDKFDAETMASDVASILDAGMDLTILRRVPNDPSYDPRERALIAVDGTGALDLSGISLKQHLANNREVDSQIDKAVARFPSDRVHVFSPADLLCPDEVCVYQRNGVPFYIDTNHLSFIGAMQLSPFFETLFNE